MMNLYVQVRQCCFKQLVATSEKLQRLITGFGSNTSSAWPLDVHESVMKIVGMLLLSMMRHRNAQVRASRSAISGLIV